MHKGRVLFGAMDEVVFGRPAHEAIVEQMDRLGASRAFLMVSGTLNRADRRDRKNPPRAGFALCRHLRCDAAAHAARGGDRRQRAGAGRQRRPHRHDRRRLDHRRRQGRAALPCQQCSHRGRHRDDPGPPRRGSRNDRANSAPGQRADDDRRRRILRHCRRHQREDPRQGNAAPSAGDAAGRDPRSLALRAHAGMAVALDRHPRRRSLRRGHLLGARPTRTATRKR